MLLWDLSTAGQECHLGQCDLTHLRAATQTEVTPASQALLSFQMRWIPPSEATSQGWKSRQFC